MRRNLLVATLLVASLTPALADHEFFTRDSGSWRVVGFKATKELHPHCALTTNYPDGSEWTIYRDLKDAELYMIIRNVNWEFPAEVRETTMEARLNFMGNRGTVTGGTLTIEVLNKNTVRARKLTPEKVALPFMQFAKMAVIMPGNYTNLGANLMGSSEAIQNLSQCIDVSKTVALYPPSAKPNPAPTPAPAVLPRNLSGDVGI
jgi:hypothetical protein